MKGRAAIVILNWNKPDDTIECIESCLAVDYDPFEVIVVDNHSSDRSVELIRKRFPGVFLIENSDNLGYAGGNNVGMREALGRGADYVLLLNNDVVVDRNMLKILVDEAKNCPKAGMLAPKVLYYDERSVINSMGTSVDWLRLKPRLGEFNKKDAGQYSLTERKEILMGCALFIKKEVLDKIGLIDEKFFIFHEEADWCFRSLKRGFLNLVVPKAVVYHKASKTMREFSALSHYYSVRNFLYLVHKNAGWASWWLSRAGLLFLLMKNTAVWLSGKERTMTRAFFLGVADYFLGRMGRCERVF